MQANRVVLIQRIRDFIHGHVVGSIFDFQQPDQEILSVVATGSYVYIVGADGSHLVPGGIRVEVADKQLSCTFRENRIILCKEFDLIQFEDDAFHRIVVRGRE